MGFAMLWIIFFHSSVDIPNFLLPLKFCKEIGYSGVDIFFLLSGIGLVFSITNDKSVVTFYKKRILRIIPTYWACLLVIFLNNLWGGEVEITSFFLSFVGLDFIILGKSPTWFVPSIFFCYAFFPAYYSLSTKYDIRWITLWFSIVAIVSSVLIVDTFISHLLIFTIRIPVFLFGCYVGFLLVHKKTDATLNNLYINGIVLFLSLAVLAAILLKTDSSFRWSTGLWWYPAIFMAFPISVLVGFVLGKIEFRCSLATKIFRFFGIYSLELYLIHGLFFGLASKLPLKDMNWNFYRVPEYSIYLICAVALSILLNCFTSKARLFFTICMDCHDRQG